MMTNEKRSGIKESLDVTADNQCLLLDLNIIKKVYVHLQMNAVNVPKLCMIEIEWLYPKTRLLHMYIFFP